MLLWLAATALFRPLAWELPYAAGAALEKDKKKKKEKDVEVCNASILAKVHVITLSVTV